MPNSNTQYFTSIATKCSLYILKFHHISSFLFVFLYRFMQYARFALITLTVGVCILLLYAKLKYTIFHLSSNQMFFIYTHLEYIYEMSIYKEHLVATEVKYCVFEFTLRSYKVNNLHTWVTDEVFPDDQSCEDGVIIKCLGTVSMSIIRNWKW
jgi:hypothetical protein